MEASMSRRRNRPQPQQQKADPNIAVVVANQGVATPATMPRNMRAYIQEGFRSKTVYRVVGHIARAGAGIKWKHFTDNTKQKEVTNSDLMTLWNTPAPPVQGSHDRLLLLNWQLLHTWHQCPPITWEHV